MIKFDEVIKIVFITSYICISDPSIKNRLLTVIKLENQSLILMQAKLVQNKAKNLCNKNYLVCLKVNHFR